MSSKARFFPISSYEAVDIDDPIDFEIADALMQLRNKNLFQD